MIRVKHFVVEMWQPFLIYGALGGLILGLLAFRIGSLPQGLSSDEVAALSGSQSLKAIIDNPLFLPHKILLFGVNALGIHNLAVYRGISVFWGALTLILFYGVLRHWFTRRIAALGTFLCASSTWFLTISRLATPYVLWFGLVALLAIGGWLRFSRARVLPVLGAIALGSILLYVPGMVWFVAAAVIWQRRTIKQALLDSTPSLAALSVLLFLLLIAPLLYALVRAPALGRELLGIPSAVPNWHHILQNLGGAASALFCRAPLIPSYWLGRLPLLDIFTSTMFVLGLYSFYYQRQLDRVKTLLGAALVAGVLIALGNVLALTLLVPLVYMIVASGINLMLQQWLTVFPRNPLARIAGVSVLVIAISAAVGYQTGRYFVAWQHAPQTKNTYSHTL